MVLFGYMAAVLIGISLGMIGGGGSILTVPVLVYLLGVEPVLATTYSLFIVGMTSLAGSGRMYFKNLINFKAVLWFGIPSIITVFITRKFVVPAIPPVLFHIGGFEVNRNVFLMLVFALLMVFSAISMMREKKCDELHPVSAKTNMLPLVLQGLFVGFITGLLGAGGGFLIIPALVLFIRLPMKEAVATSLMIIAINSLAGFLFSHDFANYNWSMLGIVTGLAVIGVMVGSLFSEKIPAGTLKKGFGWFVLLMGIWVIVKELLL